MKPKIRFFYYYIACIIIFCPITFQYCAPVFSELQSARTVGKNNIEATPFYTTTSGIQDHLGLQASYGVSSKVDIRARYEEIWAGIYDKGTHEKPVTVIGIGPKYRLIKNKMAFSVPLGRALGENHKDSWQVQPAMLLTLPAIKNKIEFTLSPKYLIIFGKPKDLPAVNLGASFSTNLDKWALRPEYGMLFYRGGENERQFSVGLSFTLHNR